MPAGHQQVAGGPPGQLPLLQLPRDDRLGFPLGTFRNARPAERPVGRGGAVNPASRPRSQPLTAQPGIFPPPRSPLIGWGLVARESMETAAELVDRGGDCVAADSSENWSRSGSWVVWGRIRQ